MSFIAILLTLLILTGCSSTNISALVEQLAKDPAANCIMVNTPYGSVILARGTPATSVDAASAGCRVTGSGMTNVQVPSSAVTVTPKPQ